MPQLSSRWNPPGNLNMSMYDRYHNISTYLWTNKIKNQYNVLHKCLQSYGSYLHKFAILLSFPKCSDKKNEKLISIENMKRATCQKMQGTLPWLLYWTQYLQTLGIPGCNINHFFIMHPSSERVEVKQKKHKNKIRNN